MRRMLLDTEILLRFAIATDPQHAKVLSFLREALEDDAELCFAPKHVVNLGTF